MAVHGGKWQMGEPRAGGQPQTALGRTHWEVVQGGAGEKSLPPMPVRQTLADTRCVPAWWCRRVGREGGLLGVGDI